MLKTGWDLPEHEIAARYRAVSAHRRYDLVRAHDLVIALARRCVDDGLLRVAGTVAMDLGCGTGVLMESLGCTFPAWNISGFDPSYPQQAEPKRLAPNAVIEHGSAYDVAATDGSYDLVVMSEVLEHLNRPDVALQRVAHLLRAGGMLIVTLPNASAFPGWKYWERLLPFQAAYRRLLPSEHPKRTWQPIDTLYEYDEIVDLLERTGFEVVYRDGAEYLRPLLYGAPLLGRYYRRWRLDRHVKRWLPHRYAYRVAFALRNHAVAT
jgi:2-polyprenyl-3-methyl-5-hydroxy-6-metoxy-1,4-benzoquinol methylase